MTRRPHGQSLLQRVYAVLFRFLGPAQLGTFTEPETRPADDAYTCPVCGFAVAEHEVRFTQGRRRMTCPGPALSAHP